VGIKKGDKKFNTVERNFSLEKSWGREKKDIISNSDNEGMRIGRRGGKWKHLKVGRKGLSWPMKIALQSKRTGKRKKIVNFKPRKNVTVRQRESCKKGKERKFEKRKEPGLPGKGERIK